MLNLHFDERERAGNDWVRDNECGKTTTKAKNFANSKVNARNRDKHTNNTTCIHIPSSMQSVVMLLCRKAVQEYYVKV